MTKANDRCQELLSSNGSEFLWHLACDCLTKGFEVEGGSVDRAIQHTLVRYDNFTVTWKTKKAGLE